MLLLNQLFQATILSHGLDIGQKVPELKQAIKFSTPNHTETLQEEASTLVHSHKTTRSLSLESFQLTVAKTNQT